MKKLSKGIESTLHDDSLLPGKKNLHRPSLPPPMIRYGKGQFASSV